MNTTTIDQDVLDLIRTGSWEDGGFTMPMTSDKKLYQRTAKVLEALGGKWNKKAKATLFEDEDAEASLREAVRTGTYVDLKQAYQFFETPPAVIQIIENAFDGKPFKKKLLLEPSAGRGAIAQHFRDKGCKVTAVELNPEMCPVLEALDLDHVFNEDFLRMQPDTLGLFDLIAMNPPFTRSQDIKHVKHAYNFLKPGGKLVAVMSPGFTFRSDMLADLFRTWLSQVGDITTEAQGWSQLPKNSFVSSGTNVNTVLVEITKRRIGN